MSFLENLKNIFTSKKSIVGVDIGAFSIKIVQLTKKTQKYQLDTYGEIHFFAQGSEEELDYASLKLLDDQVALILKDIFHKAKVTTKNASFGMPVYSSFSTVIDMPKMPISDLKKAVMFEARQYIPVPIDQVFLSFMIIGKIDTPEGRDKIKILLSAIPIEIKNKYENIAKKLGLVVDRYEVETFAMARALYSEEDKDKTLLIIDIGAKSTNFCIAKNGVAALSHHFDKAGVDITKSFFNLGRGDMRRADSLKKSMGLKMTPGQKADTEELFKILETIIFESERIITQYQSEFGGGVDKVVLSGGSALMPGLLEFFQENFKKEVVLADPFKDIFVMDELRPVLKKIGPSFSVAVGLAMK